MEGKNKKTKVVKWAAVMMLAAMMIVGCKQAQGNSSSGEENKKTETPVTPNTPAAAEKYEVTVSAGSNGKVEVAPKLPADNKVPKGQELTITATAKSGYVVEKWTVTPTAALQTGGANGSDTATAKVKVTANTTVNVTFKLKGGTPPPPPAGDFVTITPLATGITGMDPDPASLPGTGDYWKGVFRAGRKVKLSPYKLGKTEVPYKLWKEVYDWAIQPANGYKFANAGVKGKDGSGSEEEPVTKVSWRDCIVWCNAYTQKIKGEGECVYRKKDDHTVVLKDATDGDACDNASADMRKKGYRLPTEAEWEYAARWQGSDNTNADKYGEVWLTKLNSASGAKADWNNADETKAVAWYGDNSDSKTHPAGEKRKNALGLHDMSGNVWEWCFDWYDNIEAGDVTDPQGAASGSVRVVRGGSWEDDAGNCVVGLRNYFYPVSSNGNLGFRVAISKN